MKKCSTIQGRKRKRELMLLRFDMEKNEDNRSQIKFNIDNTHAYLKPEISSLFHCGL